MQRVVGAVLILLATGGAGILYGIEQQCYLENLLYIRHIVYMLKGEMDYANIPLGEMFGRISVRVKNPYKKWLRHLEQQVERREDDGFFKIWMRSVDQDLNELHLKSEHFIQLKELGTYLGKMDSASESRNLQIYVDRLELEIEKVRGGLVSKKRIGSCLGIMGGLFLIVVLI